MLVTEHNPLNRRRNIRNCKIMERWSGKIAVVTGAGVGIGAAVVHSLLRANVIVIGLEKAVKNIQVKSHSEPITWKLLRHISHLFP